MLAKYKWARDEVSELLAQKLQALPEGKVGVSVLLPSAVSIWLWVTALACLRVVLVWVAATLGGIGAIIVSPLIALYAVVDVVWMTSWFVVKAFRRMKK